MPKIIETTVYTFDELSEKAKDRAREWYRAGMENEDYAEYVLQDAETIAGILGIALKYHDVPLMNGKTRRQPNIWYTLHVQGAGACVEGTYSYAKGAHRNIRKHAPEDTELHVIADGLLAVQKDYAYSLTATLTASHSGTHASIEVDSDRSSPSGEDCSAVATLLSRFMDWIYESLVKEYEYQTDDENVDERLRDNEYTFTAEGKREGL